MYEWWPKNTQNLFIKNCVFILTCLIFSHVQTTLHLMQYTYQDVFSTVQNRSWTHRFWCLSSVSAVFVSPLPHWQDVFFWGLFSSGKQRKKKKPLGQNPEDTEGRTQGSCPFWSKIAEHSAQCGQVLGKSPIVNGQMHWKHLPKKFTEAEHSLSQRQLVHGYRWVPRTLTYQRKLGLQGALPPENNSVIWGGSPLYTSKCYTIILTQDYLQ